MQEDSVNNILQWLYQFFYLCYIFFAIKMKNIINFCYQNIMFIMFLNDMNIINCYVKTCLIPVILRTHEMYYICFTCM